MLFIILQFYSLFISCIPTLIYWSFSTLLYICQTISDYEQFVLSVLDYVLLVCDLRCQKYSVLPPPLRIGPAPPRCYCVARSAVDLQEPPLLEVPRLPPSLLEPARGGPASLVPAGESPSAVSFAWPPGPSAAPPATPSREEVQRRQAQALVLPRHRPRYASISLPIVFWTKFVLWFQLLNNCITRTKAKRHKDTFKHRRKPMTQYSCKVVYLSIPMPSSTARQTKVQIQDGRFRG